MYCFVIIETLRIYTDQHRTLFLKGTLKALVARVRQERPDFCCRERVNANTNCHGSLIELFTHNETGAFAAVF